ncbi:hypothetical protein [Anaeromicrobium sediminis]|uniref:Uncharacterized protein n=1 Tax=Anaeromicrobium sediminis TaxID=1478221 RepID=A0A267MIX9_9FIRM|nr:hypothetical protein [Anaeromicrobium sediminis]PAB59544.1 hypothetical protein CCE28_10040 [Anaeromicrobium sediminis]
MNVEDMNFMEMLGEQIKDDPQLKGLNSFLSYYVYESDENIEEELDYMIKGMDRVALNMYDRDLTLVRRMRNEYVTDEVKIRAAYLQRSIRSHMRGSFRGRRRRPYRNEEELNEEIDTSMFSKLAFFYMFRSKTYFLPQ